ncbi:hypothetical protein [Streptomyces sp. NPDC054863]
MRPAGNRGHLIQPTARSARATNRLTERWATAGPGHDRPALADATLWPLLALLATDGKNPDAWAAERTGGLIRTLPVALNEDTRLVPAAAQTVRTRRPSRSVA